MVDAPCQLLDRRRVALRQTLVREATVRYERNALLHRGDAESANLNHAVLQRLLLARLDVVGGVLHGEPLGALQTQLALLAHHYTHTRPASPTRREQQLLDLRRAVHIHELQVLAALLHRPRHELLLELDQLRLRLLLDLGQVLVHVDLALTPPSNSHVNAALLHVHEKLPEVAIVAGVEVPHGALDGLAIHHLVRPVHLSQQTLDLLPHVPGRLGVEGGVLDPLIPGGGVALQVLRNRRNDDQVPRREARR